MKKKFILAGIFALMMSGAALNAQVTVGKDKTPETFSVLELISNNQRGLRLPHLTTAQRDAVQATFGALATTEAEGLTIFNTDTRCVETWNGSKWIGMCAAVPCASIAGSYNFCDTDNATIDDLNHKFNSSLEWFDVEVGGTALPVTTILQTITYYARGCVDANGQKDTTRIPVNVVACNVAPTVANNRITTFTNVMYDFQTQVLEAYTTGGGGANAWQWQVSKTRSGGYTNIPGANTATFTVPAHFIDGYAGATNDELFFKCNMTNPKGSALTSDANALGIEFIKTNTAGYGGIGTNTPYLTIQRSTDGITPANGTMNVALLNLGASEGNDASDLGDFYQWGRVADGHEKTVWSKSAAHVNQIIPMTGGGATSEGVAKNAGQTYIDYTLPSNLAGQLNPATSTNVGKFIISSGDWGDASAASDARWGNSSNVRATAADALSEWSFVNNNPCPAGWRVPSRFEQFDMYRVSADGNPGAVATLPYDETNANNNNKWRWRAAANNAYGGVIVTNASGEKLFLPVVANRYYGTGNLQYVGEGLYWSSVWVSVNSAYYSNFQQGVVYAGIVNANHGAVRAFGMSVRCVGE